MYSYKHPFVYAWIRQWMTLRKKSEGLYLPLRMSWVVYVACPTAGCSSKGRAKWADALIRDSELLFQGGRLLQ